MHDAHEFLRALTIVLGVAAVTTVVFQRLRQPVVLGYIMAGLIVGPHVPIPLVADNAVVQTLSELGVVLLMFSLGLEFSLRKLAQVGPRAGLTAVLQSSLMVWLGFLIGRLFGWTVLESLFAGAVIAISSTTIIAKAFDEQGISGSLRELVVGILIVEDLIAILLMAVLTAIASGSGLSAGPLALTLGRLAAFLVGLIAVGLLFAAVFFLSVGMLIDPALIVRYWPAVAVLTATVVLGKVLGVSLGAFLAGNGMRTSVQAGLSLAQIGEFSFIIAGLGLSLQATGEFLYPVAVAVSALTTLLTPWLIRASGPVASWVDRKLPKPLQTFAALYGSWVEELRSRRPADTALARIRRLLRLLLLDAALLAGIVVGTSAAMEQIVAFARSRGGVPETLARALLIALAVALSLPFGIGVIRVGRRLGLALAKVALPAHMGKRVDFAAAPRRALVVTLQLATLLVVGALLLALTQPFLPSGVGAALLAASLAGLGVAFWRSTTNLQNHVRAGAQVIVEALAAQSRRRAADVEGDVLEQVHQLLPGLGALVAVRLDAGSAAIGKTLAKLNLRGLTGATVLAIIRGESGVIVPTANELLRAGDVLAVAGTHDAIEAARTVLTGSGT